MQEDGFAAIGPYAYGRALGVAVALELLQSVGAFRFLAFDDDVGGVPGPQPRATFPSGRENVCGSGLSCCIANRRRSVPKSA